MGISRYRYLHYDVFTRSAVRRQPARRLSGGRRPARRVDAADRTRDRFCRDHVRDRGRASRRPTCACEFSRPAGSCRWPVTRSSAARSRSRETGRIADGRTDWVFGLNIGPIPVSLEWGGPRLDFAWMTQGTPEFGRPIDDLGKVAAALGLGEEDIRATGLPVQQVSCGVPFVVRTARHAGRGRSRRAGHAPARLRGLRVYDRSRRRGGFGHHIFQDVRADARRCRRSGDRRGERTAGFVPGAPFVGAARATRARF